MRGDNNFAYMVFVPSQTIAGIVVRVEVDESEKPKVRCTLFLPQRNHSNNTAAVERGRAI